MLDCVLKRKSQIFIFIILKEYRLNPDVFISKVLRRIILNRIASVKDPYLCKKQSEFRKEKSCADHICSIRQVLEQINQWNTTLYANFIDLSKALTVFTVSHNGKSLCIMTFPTKSSPSYKCFIGTFAKR